MTADGSLPDATSNEDVLLREDMDEIAILSMNRPQARNSLSLELLESLNRQFDDISTSKDIKAVILRGNGAVFCAGHDIRELEGHRSDADGGAAYFNKTFDTSSRLMQSIVSSPKPVIAAIEATATAAGTQLVASCDLAVTSEDAKFCTPGVHIGLFCSTPAVAVVRNIGRKRALEMLLLGEMLDAQKACDFGLVNRVAPADKVMPEALAMARTIASKSAAAIALGKRAFNEQSVLPLGEAYDTASRAMADNMLLQDAEEGLGAFLEKRPPHWRDA